MADLRKPLLFALLCAIWGSTWIVIKEGYGGLGPFNVAAIRFFLAAAVMFPVAYALRVRMPQGRREWSLVGFVGVLMFTGNYGFVYWGELYLDSGLAAILFAVMPILTTIFAHLYLPQERLSLRKAAGTVLAFLGIVALFGEKVRLDPALAFPMMAIVGAAVCVGAASVATKRHGADLHPASLNAWGMLLGALLLSLASFAAGDGFRLPDTQGAWAAVVYLALAGSVVTFLGYFYLLKTWNATTMSFIAIFTPALALILGYVFRGEQPTPLMGLGAALILGGVLLATRTAAAAVPTPEGLEAGEPEGAGR